MTAEEDLASDVLNRYRAKDLKLVTAESCTGGLVSAALTAIAGSSDVLERAFVTYSNEAKVELLGVPAELIARHGAVSAEVAEAMAKGAVSNSHADVAVSVTGVAGPGGATERKPVGLVHFGLAERNKGVRHEERIFSGDRAAIRKAATMTALEFLLQVFSD